MLGTVGVMVIGCLGIAGFSKLSPYNSVKPTSESEELAAKAPPTGVGGGMYTEPLLSEDAALSVSSVPNEDPVAGRVPLPTFGNDAEADLQGLTSDTESQKGQREFDSEFAETDLGANDSEAIATDETGVDAPLNEANIDAFDNRSPESQGDIAESSVAALTGEAESR